MYCVIRKKLFNKIRCQTETNMSIRESFMRSFGFGFGPTSRAFVAHDRV
jgi:hypothetical protein